VVKISPKIWIPAFAGMTFNSYLSNPNRYYLGATVARGECPAESMDEHTLRCTQARDIIQRQKCSCLFVSDPVDVEYLSGFHSSCAFLLITRTAQWLLTDFRYQEAAAAFCRVQKGWKYSIVKSDDYSFFARYAGARPVIAFQSDIVTVDVYKKIEKAVPDARLIPLPAAVSGLSAVKSTSEIRRIARAAAIGDRAIEVWKRRVRPGITEREAALALDRICMARGSEKAAFDTIVLFGPHTALPHGRPGNRRLKRGDFVLVDFGCTTGGFCSDMTRTFICGPAQKRQRDVYGIVARAQAAACAAARAGMGAKDLDRIGRAVIERAGYGKAFGHSLGHGVGRRIHEGPHITSRSKEVLARGNVITIEPGIYLPGFGGVRIEDTVVITDKGNRPLTKFSKELIEL
jgi:Xaa-Pro aminopeptidase